MIARKRELVEQTTKGIDFLMEKNKITVFNGLGSFVVNIKIEGEKATTIEAKHSIIATGSKPGIALCYSRQSGSLLLPRR